LRIAPARSASARRWGTTRAGSLGIFSRGLAQIGLRILIGAALVSLTVARDPGGLRLVAGVALAMAAAGLLGCAVPVARALRIEPVVALRSE
jgi:ABC-type antimicrobial peptide transport system permease subunit